MISVITLLTQGHNRLAIPFLVRSLQLAPEEMGVATELAVAYCAQFQPDLAKAVLNNFDWRSNFWYSRFYYYCALLCNQPDGCDAFIADGLKMLDGETEQVVGQGRASVYKLSEILSRLRTVKGPRNLIVDWHYIQYGAAVLDLFDERVIPEGLEVAGGRWVALYVTYSTLRSMIEKLKQLLEKTGRVPQKVLAIPERDSVIIGTAIAQILQVPFQMYSGSEENTLVVCSDSAMLGVNEFVESITMGLYDILPGQTLFAANHSWLQRAPVTPDVAGFLTQTCAFPWSAGMIRVNPDTGTPEPSEEDTRSVEEIAADIVAASPVEDPNFAHHLNFYSDRIDHLKGGRNGGKKRFAFVVDSPVPGRYFC